MNLEDKAKWIRKTVVEMAANAGEGHVSSGLSCVEILITLFYGGFLNIDPKIPKWPERDRLWLSKGHGVLALYPILADFGYIAQEELMTFCKQDSRLGIHAEPHCPGIEAVFGSLGHGFNMAIGAALAAKMDRKEHRHVILLGDGECYEGQIWEAAMFASHHRLNNVLAILDRNFMCVTDHTENLVALRPLEGKWAAFGWDVEVVDGHNFMDISDALESASHVDSQRPRIIIAETVKGKGVSFMEDVALWHGSAILGEQLVEARKELV